MFEEACATLLKEILRVAGLLRDDSSGTTFGTVDGAGEGSEASMQKSLGILDLGFGCGDQTLELVRLTQPAGGWESFRYVGLTLNLAQLQTAERNVIQAYPRRAANGRSGVGSESFKLFCADAARPEKWNPPTTSAVESLSDEEKYGERWLLALDCLYHFHPSRKPVFSYAARTLRAGSMAFDLILNEQASWKDILLARLICLIMGCPLRAFLTEEEYRAELVECGYDGAGVTIKEISEHVFEPVAGFLDAQERMLSRYGVAMGGHRLAGRLFAWFGRSRVVKAVIVVARR